MKINIKNLMFAISVFLLLYPISTRAENGRLAAGDIEMECVYDSGISITIYYTDDTYGVSTSEFKLAGAITPPYASGIKYFYKENEFAKEILKSAKCPDTINYAVISQNNSSGNSITFQVYHRTQDAETIAHNQDQKFLKTKVVAGFDTVSGNTITLSAPNNSPLYKRIVYGILEEEQGTSFRFYLKSEKIYFNNEVEPIKSWAFKSEGQQAASTADYIKFTTYKNENGAEIMVAEKNQNITVTSETLGRDLREPTEEYVNYICFKPSVKNIVNEKNDMAYSFSSVRHEFEFKVRRTREDVENGLVGMLPCDKGYSLYREVSMAEYDENASSATSICDVIPETSLMIAKVIAYMGIIIPVLLIILTALDISKIVISGNIEEELPNKKKIIIIRFIVAVVFFFLPILMQIFISSEYGTDFGDISCLWSLDASDDEG